MATAQVAAAAVQPSVRMAQRLSVAQVAQVSTLQRGVVRLQPQLLSQVAAAGNDTMGRQAQAVQAAVGRQATLVLERQARQTKVAAAVAVTVARQVVKVSPT